VLARSLHQKETGTTGLIVTDILNFFHVLLGKGVQDTAEAHNDFCSTGLVDSAEKRHPPKPTKRSKPLAVKKMC